MNITYTRKEAKIFNDYYKAKMIAKQCNDKNLAPNRSQPWQVMNSQRYYVVVCLSKNPDNIEGLTYFTEINS